MTQIEQIIWHEYPSIKPPRDNAFYLIDEVNGGINIAHYNEFLADVYWGDVRAWANLPKGLVEANK